MGRRWKWNKKFFKKAPRWTLIVICLESSWEHQRRWNLIGIRIGCQGNHQQRAIAQSITGTSICLVGEDEWAKGSFYWWIRELLDTKRRAWKGNRFQRSILWRISEKIAIFDRAKWIIK